MASSDVLDEHGLRGFPKTSGSRGIHVYVRIEPRWDFPEVRRAALALAREVERRMPGKATSKWWKEERDGVFLDYNQNARDRTVASAYWVRPMPDARVSMPLRGTRCRTCEPADFAHRHGPRAAARRGDPPPAIDDVARGRSTPCSSSPAATRREGSATRRGRRTSPSSPASPSACSRAARERLSAGGRALGLRAATGAVQRTTAVRWALVPPK